MTTKTEFQRAALYSPPPDKLLAICETEEQHADLEARGWTAHPEALAEGAYAPTEARWVDHAEIAAKPAATKPSKAKK